MDMRWNSRYKFLYCKIISEQSQVASYFGFYQVIWKWNKEDRKINLKTGKMKNKNSGRGWKLQKNKALHYKTCKIIYLCRLHCCSDIVWIIEEGNSGEALSTRDLRLMNLFYFETQSF